MNFPWFKRIGILFVPAAVMGWLVLLAFLVDAVAVFRDIDSRSHSASDTLMNFAFRLVILGVLYTLVGYLTSKRLKE